VLPPSTASSSVGGGSSAASERNSRGSPAASFSMGMTMATPVIAFGSLQRPGPACGARSGDELLHHLPVRGEAGSKDLLIPRDHHGAAAVSGELVGEILGITDAQDLGRRVVSETPGRKRDRGHQGFEMVRWQIADPPLDPAFPHVGQLGGDDIKMPVHRELGLWVEVMETARSEGVEVHL